MVTLKNIDTNNYKQVIQLEVTEEQESFVASNSYSLLEANYEEQHYPLGIYEQEELVGFLMYAFYPADEEYPKDSWWILRLMIDKDHQGKGYGRQAIEEFEAYFKKKYEVKELRISAEPTNNLAVELYERMGFKKNYMREWDLKRLEKQLKGKLFFSKNGKELEELSPPQCIIQR